MFATSSMANERPSTDTSSTDNFAKWKGLFTGSLQKVQRQVHMSLSAREDALEYIEKLIWQLLKTLCTCQPHSVGDVEDHVQKTFPHPIDKWAIKDAQNALEKGKKKATLVLPVDKIHPMVREVLGYKVDNQVTLYIVAVLEYIAADILKLTGNYVKNIKHQEITVQDIKVAMCADKVLMDMFFQDDDDAMNMEEEQNSMYVRRGSLTYENIVKDLILEENQYMRDLNMIIKVFRSRFARLFPRSKDLDVIFSNIIDIQELTAKLLSSLEDTIEVTDEGAVPLIGTCFEDLAEGQEFDCYEHYAEYTLMPNGRDRLNALLQRNDTSFTFQSAGHLFKDAVKYVLPKLLLGPIYHCLRYFDVIKTLIDITTDREDQESLEQALGSLYHLKMETERKLTAYNLLKRKPGGTTLRFHGRAERETALNKMNELQKSIDGWEGKDIGQSCNEFIMEGKLQSYTGRRLAERYVFLFDGLIILTKQNTKRSSVTGPVGEYKLKEKFNIRRVDVQDREDTDDLKNVFELQVRDHPSLILVCKTAEDKNNWMAALVLLLTRSMLERMLDSTLNEEEKKTPLRLPSPEKYRFAEMDSCENIVFEDVPDQMPGVPQLIKGGTLVKLVERLTYHTYADINFLRTFLTTYRTFSNPYQLLELLVERFDIPDPVLPMDEEDGDEAQLAAREALKRFRKEYYKPVQFRVLNVIRHWVEHHWYDYVWHGELLDKLKEFLKSESIRGKAVRKCVESINKIITRKRETGQEKQKQFTYQNQPPQIETHIAKKPEDFDLMTLHPIEIARQVTLLEFDLYRAVKPSEMVGSVWIKKEKYETSPNLLKMIQHSTRFTFSLEKCIIEAENFEERVAVFSRILEIMLVFQELNNFNGVLEVVSALNSAPVYRLEHTFEEADQKYRRLMKAFDEAKELNSNHFKMYIEKLRSINPPCVPFLGMYLTNILLTEEGNPNFLPKRPDGIINFSKRRKVAEITAEIQQYQNQPYCLTVDSDIRTFFESLNPLEGMTEKEFNDYLYSKSLELEPRNSRAPMKAERKRDYSLKSPGIKPMPSRHSTSSLRSEKSHPTSLSPSTETIQEGPEAMDGDIGSCGATPPTPSTPITPPFDSSGDNNSVFSTVMIPGSSFSDTSSLASVSTLTSVISNNTGVFATPPTPTPLHRVPPPLETTSEEDKPPPLPPRRRRDHGELSPVTRTPLEPPTLPPRDALPRDAPPLPPRRSEYGHSSSHATLPTRHSMPLHAPPLRGIHSKSLSQQTSQEHFMQLNVNGDRSGSVTPELPPKTYRSSSHSRKQSS